MQRDSLTVIIDSFQTLQKTRENKIKFKDEMTEQFRESYQATLLNEVNTLRMKMHLNTLQGLVIDLHYYPQLKVIYNSLSALSVDDLNEEKLVAVGENISDRLSNILIALLQKVKMSRQGTESSLPASRYSF